ncbi:MAG: hypothetical protein V9F04_17905 [Dermatophilaceae bacterium]
MSPASVTFTSCADTKVLTVTAGATGTATVTVTQTANTMGGTFDLAPATFTVTVTGATNHVPVVAITGVAVRRQL